jgi:hypothetical protein
MEILKQQESLFNLMVEGVKTKEFRKLKHLQRFLLEIQNNGYIDLEVVTPEKYATDMIAPGHGQVFEPKKLGKVRLTLDSVYEFESIASDFDIGEISYFICTREGVRIRISPQEAQFIQPRHNSEKCGKDYYEFDDPLIVFHIEILEVYGK